VKTFALCLLTFALLLTGCQTAPEKKVTLPMPQIEYVK